MPRPYTGSGLPIHFSTLTFAEHMYKTTLWWYTVLEVHKLPRVIDMIQGKKALFLLPLCAMLALGLHLSLRADAASAHSAQKSIIVIDPGHGGEDGGAVAVSGTPESRINLDIALRTDQLCGLLGIRSTLLRTKDVSLADEGAGSIREKKRSDLKNRANLVNQIPGARLLSIHQNFFERESPHGAQAFYRGDEASLTWAQALQDSLRNHLDPENTRTAVQVPEFVYLMRHVDCPAVLVECGFLSNPEEDAKLEDAAYQKKLAAVLAVSCLEQPTGQPST